MILTRKTYIMAFMAMVLITCVSVVYAVTKPAEVVTQDNTVYLQAETPEPVVLVNTVTRIVHVPITMYDKDSLAEVLPDIPTEIIESPDVEVIAVKEVRCPDNAAGATAIVSLDTSTGEARVHYRPLPATRRPAIDLFPSEIITGRFRVSAMYGLSSDAFGGQKGAVSMEAALLRIWDITLSLEGMITTEPEAIAWIKASYGPTVKRYPSGI